MRIEDEVAAVGFDLACAEQLEILEQKEKADELMFFAKINGVPMDDYDNDRAPEYNAPEYGAEHLRKQGVEVW